MSRNSRSIIERDVCALVIIDIQERLAAAMADADTVLAATDKLARTFSMLGAPIIVTRQYPKGLGSTVPVLESVLLELAEDGANVLGVDKMAFCCSEERDFIDALRATGRTQVALVGMETHICVAQTSLSLHAEGFDVHVAADGCCSRVREAHDIALDRMRSAGVTVTWSESVMYEAVGMAGTDEFKRLLQIVKA